MEIRRAVALRGRLARSSSLCTLDVVYVSPQLFEMEGTGSERLHDLLQSRSE